MALPVIASDGDLANASMIQRAISSNGKANIKELYATIAYDGAAWGVVATRDSSELVSGNILWDTDHVEIALVGYTVAPTVTAGQALAATPYLVQAEATADDLVQVKFWTMAGVLVVVEDVSMRFGITIIGA